MHTITRYNPSDSPKLWDEFVAASDNGTMFHQRLFLSYHPADRFLDHSLVFTRSDELFAVFPAVETTRGGKRILSSHSGASYGGVVYKKELNLRDAHECVKLLVEYAGSRNFDAVQITLPPVIYLGSISNYLDFALLNYGFTYVKRELSSVVALPQNPENIMTLYREEARRAVRKSIKSGIEIAETDRFEEYYKILGKNLKMRHGVTPTHTLEELLLLKKKFPTKIRLHGAFLENKLIAGVCNFSANNRVVLAFYISHDEEFQEYRPVNYLFWDIMRKSAVEGFSYLDFGIFTVNMDPNWGLARFKENFGSRGIFRDTLILKLR